MKIINNFRSGINEYSEGRQRGVEFAFATKNNDTEYTLIHAMTTCKDFLNDTLHAEIKKIEKPFTIYKLKSWYRKLFTDDVFYLVTKMRTDPKVKYCFSNAIRELNKVEEIIGISASEMVECEDNFYLFKMNKYWIKTTYHISFVTLLIRCLIYKTDIESSFKEYLEDVDLPFGDYDYKDYLNLDKVLPILKDCTYYEDILLKDNPKKIHDIGIVHLYKQHYSE